MKHRWTGMLTALGLAAATPAAAQSVYVTAARLADVETGRLVANPAVLITAGRISQVGTQATLKPPADATRIDLPGLTLVPGLIDMHVHLASRHDQGGYRSLALSVPAQTLQAAANAQINALAGFTTVRDVGSEGQTVIAVRDAIRAGSMVGPRILASSNALGARGGHCDSNLLPPEFNQTAPGVAIGPWGFRDKVRETHKRGADVIKVCATGGVLSKGTAVGAQQLSTEELRAIVEEAHMLGLKVAAHAHGQAGIRAAIEAGVDTVEHASFMDDETIQRARQQGTWLSMDIYNTEFILGEGEAAGILPESLEKERLVGGTQRRSFTRAVQAGAKVVFGSDAGVYPHGNNARQFSRMVRFGMTPLQAVQAATVQAAEALGRAGEVGVLKPGAWGDLIAVAGNPFEDVGTLESVDTVLVGGQLLKRAGKAVAP